jgi:hypothetical protein
MLMLISGIKKRSQKMSNYWRFSGERCPKCGASMILNYIGHECGEWGCDYIEPKPKLMTKEDIKDVIDRMEKTKIKGEEE